MANTNKFITRTIAGAVLAFTALFSGSAQAYIPSDIDTEIRTSSFSLPSPNTSLDDLVSTPMPLDLPVFLRSVAAPKFQVEPQVAAAAPLGFQIFCLQYASECQADESTAAVYTPKNLDKISQVNLNVNTTMIARNDIGMDQWTLNLPEGVCEDFVLTKRSQLAAAGIPVGALRIATALTPAGVGHAVLIIRSDQGDLVLDNLNNTVKPWDAIDLDILSISGANPNQWFTVA